MARKGLFKFLTVGLTGIVFFGNFFLFSQQIDPFYLRLLKDGEKQLLSQNYREATRSLEIAAFGLPPEKQLRAKAYVYMSLAQYYLKNYEECEKYLRDAVELASEEGIESLDLKLDDETHSILRKLLNRLYPGNIQEELTEPLVKSTIEKPEKTTPKEFIKELENKIKKDPKNVPLYYDLYSFQRENNNYKGARKALELLVKNNPNEVNGFYLLGLFHFRQRKYKDAAKNFERVLQLSKRKSIKENLLLEATAYLILSFHYRNDEKHVLELVGKTKDTLTEEKIRSLSLDEKDGDKLLEVIDSVREKLRAEEDKAKIKTLEKELKKNPKNVPLYYELYNLYRKNNEFKAARKTIETLVKKNPDEQKGIYLLGKIRFSSRDYKDALKYFNQVLRPEENIKSDNELILKSLIYVSLCLFNLDRKEHLDTFFEVIAESISEEKLNQILKEEGLEKEWERLITSKQ